MKLSIITVNYNDKCGLDKTIRSVICQTFQDYEYIIVDGGSLDGSQEVIKQNEHRIDYWVSERDKGIYNAMNKAVDVASGEYCIFMNSGDTFHNPDTLSDVFSLNLTEDIICGNTCTTVSKRLPPPEITFNYLFSNSICHQCAFIKTSLMKKYKYDEKYKIVADRKFFLQALIIDNCTYKSVDVDIVNYDINGFSSQNPHTSRMEYDAVLEELFPARIRTDYGRALKGALYGDSFYEKLFLEINLRNYRNVIYLCAVVLLRCLAVFKASARFIYKYPWYL